MHKKLSYCKDNAVVITLFKVADFSTNQMPKVTSYLHPISHHFQVIVDY